MKFRSIIDYYFYPKMTGLLLAFTGWVVTITNQYKTPYCLLHAIQTCGSVYGITGTTGEIYDDIGWFQGLDIGTMHNKKRGIKPAKKYNEIDLMNRLKGGPVMVYIPQDVFIPGTKVKGPHQGCVRGYNNTHLVVANSRGTGGKYQGNFLIPKSEINKYLFQEIGSGIVLPSLVEIKQPKKKFTLKKRR